MSRPASSRTGRAPRHATSPRSAGRRRGQVGGFVLGLVVGLLLGLSLALGVALYITKAPVPFVNKVPQRTAEQDQAELSRNRNWDPNAGLGGRNNRPPANVPAAIDAAATAASAVLPGASGAAPSERDPAAILAGAPVTAPVAAPAVASAPAAPRADPFFFFVQAGAYTRADEAEQQRARLAMLGQQARITEREQNGRVVYRVRVGPFETRPEADSLQGKLQDSGIASQLVRVERP